MAPALPGWHGKDWPWGQPGKLMQALAPDGQARIVDCLRSLQSEGELHVWYLYLNIINNIVVTLY